ncbi:thioredoxin-dependent thiol peroxidase [Chitinophaga nivalis]|uniref:thioredoxin-dependent peroxiredoxin n=1 Tax=Chitinophaga nivalis TaxID=2991709 RepID=A0ABT3IWI6_9BACT|nr:thioredoxin-dependent thiol peroxidase [Chitinophaga nivalis]MCW3461971.1 thioredoxin-dependent thiol peroxidase [Chitinophaga nivalis]MCW3488338.1 thioredoxin-dependent thiol peroxidase [Chitinophaga nivalis]
MAALKEGDKAPVFKGKDQHGKTLSLTDLKGKRVILYFYPKDMTPGCTTQACNLRDNYTALLKKGYAVVGVSTDSEQSHQKFIEKYELPFTLLADEDKTIVNQYGVFGEKQMMGKTYDGIFRTTFLIDENGVIAHIIKKPDTKNHTEEILERWK